MGRYVWQEQVAALSAMLDPLEAEGAEAGSAGAGLEELKSSLDDLRLRAWGLLMAASADDPHGFQEQFRTRRGTEMCRALVSDLHTGKLSARASGLPGLGSAAKDLAAAVREVRPKLPSRRSSKGRPKKSG
jgi:hypothetical protein